MTRISSRLIFLATVLSCLCIIAEHALADDLLSTYVSPVLKVWPEGRDVEERVIIIDHPTDWIVDSRSCCVLFAPDSIHDKFFGGSSLSFYWRQPDWSDDGRNAIRFGYYDKSLRFYPFQSLQVPDQTILESLFGHAKAFAEGKATVDDLEGLLHPCLGGESETEKWGYECKQFEKERLEINGLRGLYRSFSATPLYDEATQERPEADTPNTIEYWLMSDDQESLMVKFSPISATGLSSVERFNKLRPVVEEMIQTLRFVPVSAVGDSVTLTANFDSGTQAISKRGSHEVNSSFSFDLPVDWGSRTIRFIPAGPDSEQGELAVEFLPPPGEAQSLSTRFVVVLQGLPVGPLTATDFLATTQSFLAEYDSTLSDLELVSSASVDHVGMSFLAGLSTRYTESTGSTQVRQFETRGGDGEALVVKAYTAGGMTMAANAIIIATPEDMEVLGASMETLAKEVEVAVYSPSIRLE